MKTRRTLCPSCFGQGIRYYLADATGRQTLHVGHYDTEDVWGFLSEFPEEYEIYCTGIEGKNAYIQSRICRKCGGTGWAYVDAWAARFRKRCAPSRFVSTYGLFIVYKNPFENLTDEDLDHYKDQFHLAAEQAYEIRQLDRKINRLHRRAQKAEGRAEHFERLYKKKCDEADRLLNCLQATKGRAAKTVRTKKKLKEGKR